MKAFELGMKMLTTAVAAAVVRLRGICYTMLFGVHFRYILGAKRQSRNVLVGVSAFVHNLYGLVARRGHKLEGLGEYFVVDTGMWVDLTRINGPSWQLKYVPENNIETLGPGGAEARCEGGQLWCNACGSVCTAPL